MHAQCSLGWISCGRLENWKQKYCWAGVYLNHKLFHAYNLNHPDIPFWIKEWIIMPNVIVRREKSNSKLSWLNLPSLGFIIQIFNIITIHQILERQGTDYPSHDIPESLSQTESWQYLYSGSAQYLQMFPINSRHRTGTPQYKTLLSMIYLDQVTNIRPEHTNSQECIHGRMRSYELLVTILRQLDWDWVFLSRSRVLV